MLQSYSGFISHSMAYSVWGSAASSLLFVWACNCTGRSLALPVLGPYTLALGSLLSNLIARQVVIAAKCIPLVFGE